MAHGSTISPTSPEYLPHKIKQNENWIQETTQHILVSEKQNVTNNGYITGQIHMVRQSLDAAKKTLELDKQELIRRNKFIEERELAKIEQAKLEQEQQQMIYKL